MHNYDHSKVSSEGQKYTVGAGNWQDLTQGRVPRHKGPIDIQQRWSNWGAGWS